MQNENDFLVRNPKKLIEYLTDIFKSKCILSAHFGEHNLSFLTVILELDVKNKVLKIDSAPSELLNKQLLASEKVLFRTQYEGIKVSFRGQRIKKSSSDNHPALEMQIPDAIFWMQRRQYFRVKIPFAHNGSFCVMTLPQDEQLEPVESKTFKFKLADIGLKGFSFLNPHMNLAEQFAVDKQFHNCTLSLHSGASENISFAVKVLSELKVNTTSTQQRVGCAFLTSASAQFESGIQLYMQDIERQLKNIG